MCYFDPLDRIETVIFVNNDHSIGVIYMASDFLRLPIG